MDKITPFNLNMIFFQNLIVYAAPNKNNINTKWKYGLLS